MLHPVRQSLWIVIEYVFVYHKTLEGISQARFPEMHMRSKEKAVFRTQSSKYGKPAFSFVRLHAGLLHSTSYSMIRRSRRTRTKSRPIVPSKIALGAGTAATGGVPVGGQ